MVPQRGMVPQNEQKWSMVPQRGMVPQNGVKWSMVPQKYHTKSYISIEIQS